MIKHIKGISLLIVMLTSSVAFAEQGNTTNAIYIEQIGDTSDITVTQIGQGNRVGQANDRFDLTGDNQWITINQQGPRNIIMGQIIRADNVRADISQAGFDNSANINLGQIGAVTDSFFQLHVQGNGNVTNFTQGAVTSAINGSVTYGITGDLNTITSNIETNDVVNEAQVLGSFNTIAVLQNGYAGKTSQMNIDGNNNNITVNQTSISNADTLLLNSTGSDSVITVNQCTSSC